MPLKKIKSILRADWICAAISALVLLSAADVAFTAPCDVKSTPPTFIQHNLNTSYCELCGYGYVTIVITNPYEGANMTDMTVREDLDDSGLTFTSAPGVPTPLRVNGVPRGASAYPTVSGPNGSILIWHASQISELGNLPFHPNPNSNNTITITFAVTRHSSVNQEGLVGADRRIQAALNFSTVYEILPRTDPRTYAACPGTPRTEYTGIDTLPLREPVPSITKSGWNYDAGQRRSSASDPVYGNNNDDVVWRIRVQNNGEAGLQDLRFDDLMQSGNMVVNYACSSESAANTIASQNGGGPIPANCVAASNTIDDFIVDAPFGNAANSWDGHEVDVTAGGNASIYLVGKITADGSCTTRRTNTVQDFQWGCEADSPAGGITATSTGVTPTDVARLYTQYNDGHPLLEVERRLTGTNTSQPVGSKGTMTITIRNNSGGSVKNIHLRDVLPTEYVVDPTYPPAINVNPDYGAYPGMIDTIVWTNENTSNPLANTTPEFDLTSNGVFHPVYSDQINMLRHGDVAVVTFRVVLIQSDYYDRSANLDVNPEVYPGTDPTYQTPLANTLIVDFDTFCPSQNHQIFTLTGNGTGNPNGSDIPAFPEDLDIAIGGGVFILTNDTTQILTLPVLLTNNGGHDATDFHAFVSFGTTMEVVNAPAACSPILISGVPPQPDPWKVWISSSTSPIAIPGTATVYECTAPATIAPGQTVRYNFDVVKTTNPARILIDDLSFRADVVGEITLSDRTPLTFPAPITRPDDELDRANNYSLDTTWARVIGFNLKKTQHGPCNENNLPTYDANGYEEVQIGEECTFHIETGGWFGFETPGFAYIAVQNIDVVDQVPNGQAYISSTNPYNNPADPNNTSTPLVAGVTLNPGGLAALNEGWFDWRFNVTDAERIEQADEWFRVNTTTRLLNKPQDQSLAPNFHTTDSYDVLNSTFDATFRNDNTNETEKYTLGPSTVGYPNEPIRRVDLTVTEPQITVLKEVCNESLYGSGTDCSRFVPLADDGDAYNSYIYRLTLTNEASSGGVQRAPAYDVTVTDRLDASDLAYVLPFNADHLDNDGDGAIDEADEGVISDNIVRNGTAAEITFAYTHSNPLLRINPGQSVKLYYRVDYDDDAAPLQTFTNSAVATYDSLAGVSGNQSTPQRLNSDIGGARFYTSQPGSAAVQIIPVETHPKRITALSNTPLGGIISPGRLRR